MKFLCDEMLKRLGRWLRAAGYDTVIEGDGVSDRDLIQRAVREGRLLITRDRKLMEFREAPGVVILLRSNAVQDCIQELTGRLGIDWTFQPFTRCLVCNTPLTEAAPEQWCDVPHRSRVTINHLFYCPQCGKVYWEGSHVRRMHGKLTAWQASGGK
ncbi:MAG: Mut7-C RNAse domain-containing protein [Gammaproteobacteria bacterium]|nr:Mut7-C RNAse domain-containing protein [Gammaproteobacteria bacterium]